MRGDLLLKFQLADRLGKTVAEIDAQMTRDELVYWSVYLKNLRA